MKLLFILFIILLCHDIECYEQIRQTIWTGQINSQSNKVFHITNIQNTTNIEYLIMDYMNDILSFCIEPEQYYFIGQTHFYCANDANTFKVNTIYTITNLQNRNYYLILSNYNVITIASPTLTLTIKDTIIIPEPVDDTFKPIYKILNYVIIILASCAICSTAIHISQKYIKFKREQQYSKINNITELREIESVEEQENNKNETIV
jgi:hypothetical protein